MNPVWLALESSCDETSAALVARSGRVVAEYTATQISTHQRFGGVVPEVASRAHFQQIDSVARLVLNAPGAEDAELVGVAATLGPGLIGPLLVGSSWAQGFAAGRGIPFKGVHHLRGHLASVLLSVPGEVPLQEKAAEIFPAIVLLVSGGHTQILEVGPDLASRKLADTADDAAGECFDKSAKLMGLSYPGGPQIEKQAALLSPVTQEARTLLASLPRPSSQVGFSFSGLKTAVRLKLEKDPSLAGRPDFCWALQQTISEVLVRGLDRAMTHVSASRFRSIVFCGGVAANQVLRGALKNWADAQQRPLYVPPISHAVDNAAMIGVAAWIQNSHLDLNEVSARTPLELA